MKTTGTELYPSLLLVASTNSQVVPGLLEQKAQGPLLITSALFIQPPLIFVDLNLTYSMEGGGTHLLFLRRQVVQAWAVLFRRLEIVVLGETILPLPSSPWEWIEKWEAVYWLGNIFLFFCSLFVMLLARAAFWGGIIDKACFFIGFSSNMDWTKLNWRRLIERRGVTAMMHHGWPLPLNGWQWRWRNYNDPRALETFYPAKSNKGWITDEPFLEP